MRRAILLFPVMALAFLASVVALLGLAIGPAQGAVYVCSGWIRKYDPATHSASRFVTGLSSPRIVDLEVSNNGALYYLSRGDPALVGKIRYAGN